MWKAEVVGLLGFIKEVARVEIWMIGLISEHELDRVLEKYFRETYLHDNWYPFIC